MRNAGRIRAGVLLLVGALLGLRPVFAEEQSVSTLFRVLVGKPDAAVPRTTVLDIPGPFVTLGRSPEEEAADVLQLMTKLKEAYRLTTIEIVQTSWQVMKNGQKAAIEVPGGVVTISVELLAFDEKQAAYSVSLSKKGEKPSVANVAIVRGERGFIGTRDGDPAPYLFLTVEPVAVSPRPDASTVPQAVQGAKLVHKVEPTYPSEAWKAGIDGVVILDAQIGVDGEVHDVKVLRSEPMGLTEATIDAVKQWRYEPAKDAKGKAVDSYLTVTISYMFDRSAPATPKK